MKALRQGKTLIEVERHISRYGIEFFPITINNHVNLLKEIGFSTVEVIWGICSAGWYFMQLK